MRAMLQNLAKIYSAELEGIDARRIEIEVDLNVGLHAFTIVGLADKALKESEERINSALKNSGTKPPNRENRRITVNLAPADVKKNGSQYDLGIALGYLLATKQIAPFDAERKMFIGELALDGRVRSVRGALNIAEMAQREGFSDLFLPEENAQEASVVRGIRIIPLQTLEDAIAHLEEKKHITPAEPKEDVVGAHSAPDFSEIKGQQHAKRALVIAAAGMHNLLMVGPPGVGKSLLAHALVGILPRPSINEAIEITKIYSAAGLGENSLMRARPFRAPHQTASLVSVVGGGTNPKPGEISLAHRGVLFLDEIPEFQKNILESLRQPMEAGLVRVARAKGTLAFPARFSLVAAMNPCPCGFYGDPEKECVCAAHEVVRYQKKISGPLLDRIDLQIRVPRVALRELRDASRTETSSASFKQSVEQARARQAERFARLPIATNAEMSSSQAEKLSNLDASANIFLATLDKSRLSPRGFYRLVKTARTIADLDESDTVRDTHLLEAYGYRLKEM